MAGKLQKDLKKRKGFASPEQEVVISILRTNDQFQYQFGRFFREYGLNQPQYNVLRILHGEGKPLPSLEIASRMITVVPAITALVDKLEKKGYVSRKRCENDRRVWHVSLTAPGKKLLMKMDKPNLGLHSELVSSLTKAECKQLCELLEKARTKDHQKKQSSP